MVNEPKDALAAKGLLQAHLPTLNQVHVSRRYLSLTIIVGNVGAAYRTTRAQSMPYIRPNLKRDDYNVGAM